MKKAHIVLGLGFGDEGKGVVTDWLSLYSKQPIVIRFSGGHQAGHTVTFDKKQHVFSNFGSGTFRDAPTYWSEFCTVDPIGLQNEKGSLWKEFGIKPKIIFHPDAMVTTPYDKWANRTEDKEKKHGSVGVGFGKTIERNQRHYTLKVGDLLYPNVLKEKIRAIKKYYTYELTPHFKSKADSEMEKFYACIDINNWSIQEYGFLLGYQTLIFEGSQGILLDQNYGFFPNVTRSNTTSHNANAIIDELFRVYRKKYKVYKELVTRSYQTRHGNGFMTNEISQYISNPKEKSKDTNYFMGEFRTGILDMDLLQRSISIESSKKAVHNTRPYNRLHVTCCDLNIMNEFRYTFLDNYYDPEKFPEENFSSIDKFVYRYSDKND